MWDFVASNLDISMTKLFDPGPILDRNKLHLCDSGKKKQQVLREIICAAVNYKDVNTKHFSRVIFIYIAYLLSSYTLLNTEMKSTS